MFLLLTFVAFGAGLIWTGFRVAGDWRVLLFAVVALGGRTVALFPVLRHARVEDRDRWLIAMFGPRGLSSLLLVLLPVFAGIPGAERLFEITCLVVLLSVVVHGGGIALYLRRHGGAGAGVPAPSVTPRPQLADTAAYLTSPAPSEAPRPQLADTAAYLTAPARARPAPADVEGESVPEKITIQEFRDLHRSGESIVVGDVRTERSYRDDPNIGIGAIRLPPDDAVRLARERRFDPNATLVLYCA
jgi:sodium/hydrogen antiporter